MLQHCWFYQLSTGTTAPLPAVGIAWWFGFGVSGGGGYVPPQPRTEKQEGKKRFRCRVRAGESVDIVEAREV